MTETRVNQLSVEILRGGSAEPSTDAGEVTNVAGLTSIKLYVNLWDVWTDISADVVGSITANWGITGTTPNDRVADTGTMQFTLLNGDGKYTPGVGDNVIDDVIWRKGAEIKLDLTYEGDVYTRFKGVIESITFERIATTLNLAHITVVDWMNYAGETPILSPALHVDKTADQGIGLVLETMPIQPAETVLDAGVSVFPSIFDVVRPKTVAVSEFAKLVDSELGYLYLQKGQNNGERLVFENAQHRNGLHPYDNVQVPYAEVDAILKEDGDILLTEAGDYILLNETKFVGLTSTDGIYFNDVDISHGENIVTRATVTAYPRRADGSALTLYTLGNPIEIGNGKEITFTASYTDPYGGARVGGFDMVPPEASTDYTLNTASDGSGTDITSSATVTVTFGGSSAIVKVKNGSTSGGYITTFRLRGKGVYTYDNVEFSTEDIDSINAFGYYERQYNQKYQGDLVAGTAAADRDLMLNKVPRNVLKSITYLATQSANNLLLFLCLDIGSLIEIEETQVGISGAYFIQNISFEIEKIGIIRVTYSLVEHLSYLTGTLLPATAAFNGVGHKEGINYGYIPEVVATNARSYSAWLYDYGEGYASPNNLNVWLSAPSADGGGVILYVSAAHRPGLYTNLFSSDPGQWRTTDTDTTPIDQWNHVVFTYDSSSSTDDPVIYVNGVSLSVEETLTPAGTRKSEYGANVVIGNWKTDTIDYTLTWRGLIKDVHIYNRLVTSDEVTTLYNSGTPDTSLVTDGLVFQGPCFPKGYPYWTNWDAWHNINVGNIGSNSGVNGDDYFLDNIYGYIGKIHNGFMGEGE